MKKIILKNIDKGEMHKLSAMTFLLVPPITSPDNIIYQRNESPSGFHNTRDLAVNSFYKISSKLIPKEVYDEFQ